MVPVSVNTQALPVQNWMKSEEAFLAFCTSSKTHSHIYYRCSGYHGKCELPRFREEQISEKLGEVLKGIYIPDDVLARISSALEHDQEHAQKDADAKREKLAQRLEAIRNRMSQAYADKLDGKIAEDFWQRQMSQWQAEEQQVKLSMEALKEPKTDCALECAENFRTRATGLFAVPYAETGRTDRIAQESTFELLDRCCKSFPTYRKPFDLISRGRKTKNGRGERI